MADQVTSGNEGYVVLGSSELCNLSQWQGQYQQAVLTTVTHCSSGHQVTARGNKKMSGSITAKWDDAVRLESIAKTDSLVSLQLYMATGKYWSFSARLGNISHTVNVETGALQDVSVDFESDGTVTLT